MTRITAFSRATHDRYVKVLEMTRRHPALLILLFVAHIVLSAAAALVAMVPVILFLISTENTDAYYAADALFAVVFFPLLFIIWLHFVWLNLRSVRANVRIGGNRREISGVLQALLAVIFGFSVLYYYLQLFTDNSAFVGMHSIRLRDNGFEPLPTAVERLMIVPAWNTLVDCIYFSVVTISTLGYGDIHPNMAVAKLATSAEVISGFILIVLALGSVLGDNDSDCESSTLLNQGLQTHGRLEP